MFMNLESSAVSYLEGLDWNLVEEIHLAGAELIDGVYVDSLGKLEGKAQVVINERQQKKPVNVLKSDTFFLWHKMYQKADYDESSHKLSLTGL